MSRTDLASNGDRTSHLALQFGHPGVSRLVLTDRAGQAGRSPNQDDDLEFESGNCDHRRERGPSAPRGSVGMTVVEVGGRT